MTTRTVIKIHGLRNRHPQDDRGVSAEGRQGHLIFPQMILKAPRRDGNADGDKDPDQPVPDRPYGQSFRRTTDHGYGQDPRRKASGRGRPKPRKKVYVDHPTRVEMALGKVDEDPHGIVDDAKTQGDQGINVPGGLGRR